MAGLASKSSLMSGVDEDDNTLNQEDEELGDTSGEQNTVPNAHPTISSDLTTSDLNITHGVLSMPISEDQTEDQSEYLHLWIENPSLLPLFIKERKENGFNAFFYTKYSSKEQWVNKTPDDPINGNLVLDNNERGWNVVTE